MKTPFATRLQTVFVFLMLLSIVLIAQQWQLGLYRVGIILLIVSVLLNMGVSNVPSNSGSARTLRLASLFFGIVVLIFVLAIAIVPSLYSLGQLPTR
jgi:hypothetical protein